MHTSIKVIIVALFLSIFFTTFSQIQGEEHGFTETEDSPEVLRRVLREIETTHAEMDEEVIFSHESSIQFNDFDLALSTNNLSSEIRYTLDGTNPSSTSALYEGSISVLNPTGASRYAVVVRAAAFRDSERVSLYKSHSYVFYKSETEKYKLPVISVITDQSNLYNSDTGIYVRGVTYTGSNWSGNYFQSGIEWERDVHISYFDENGIQQFEQDAGVRIHGGLQRTAAQKSLRFYARSEYGDKDFDYQLLPQKEKKSYKRFVLRTGTGDWNNTFIKDALGVDLVRGLGIEKQDYRAVIVLLNGQNFGIYWIRDYLGSKYFEDKYGVEEDSLTVVIGSVGNSASIGSNDEYQELLAFVEGNDISVLENYDSVKSKMDVYDYINYYASEIYLNNYDWPSGNLRIWKSTDYDNKWRWVLYDLDAAFNGRGGFSHNLLQQATVDGTGWPNIPRSSSLISGLLENTSFRDEFITRSAYIAHYNFKPSKILEKIDSIKALVEPEIDFQISKWSNPSSISSWNSAISGSLRGFASARNTYVQSHYKSKFGLSGTANLTLEADDSQGQITLNDLPVPQNDNVANYYKDVTIRLNAVPNYGYVFDHWEGVSENMNKANIDVVLDDELFLTAVFKIDENALSISINEVKSCSEEDEETDWIELLNNGEITPDLNEWFLSDDVSNLNKWSLINLENGLFNENGLLVINLDDNELNSSGFKISLNETVYLSALSNGSLSIVDEVEIVPVPCHLSLGDFNNEINYLIPTPGEVNQPNLLNSNPINDLFINEVLAQNITNVQDEFNENEDWVELYNGSESSVFLNGLYLTDDNTDPFKQEINLLDDELLSDDHVLFWADSDPGEYHLDFKLSKEGECVYLNQLSGSSFLTLDSVCFGSQTGDVSFGRVQDASLSFMFFTIPTPSAPNDQATGVQSYFKTDFQSSVYPNPFSEKAIIKNDKLINVSSVIMYDSHGHIVPVYWQVVDAGVEIYRNELSNGVYMYQIEGTENQFFQGKIVIIGD